MALSREWMQPQIEFREDFFTNRVFMEAHGYLWGRSDEFS
jgi:hypothetical protein